MEKRLLLVLVCLVSFLGCSGEKEGGSQASGQAAAPSGDAAPSGAAPKAALFS